MDIKGKLAETQSTLERLAHNIPGYTGYKNKEDRREADKQLRAVLAQRFQEQRDRLAEVQSQLTEAGRLASIVSLERSMMKLQLLIDRVRTAAYGYSGFFDSIKVREQQLESLQKFDAALTEQIQTVRKLIDQIAEAATKEWETGTASKDLMAALERINALFSRRQDVILGVEDDDATELIDEPVQAEAVSEEAVDSATTELPDEETPANPE